MPIKNLPTSFRKLGKIRLGESVPVMKDGAQAKNSDGTLKFRPAKIEEFRLTSPRRELLEGAAEAYGGEVKPWDGAPGEDDEWQVFTSSKVLDIVIPPVFIDEAGDVAGATFSQWNEMWNKGGCVRRCDGVTETISGLACSAMKPMCPTDPEKRSAEAAFGKACKMTTRLMVILPRVPDLGVWMVESHGWYAAVELGGFMEFLARRAPGQFVDAKLRLESRTVKRQGKTHHFAVPVIELPQAKAGELLAAPTVGRELGTGSEGQSNVRGLVSDAERVRTFVIRCSDAGWDHDIRHAIVAYATKGRTRSSREVAIDEWPAVEAVVRWFTDAKLVLDHGVSDGEAFLRKPTDAERAVPPAAAGAGGAIPVQSREAVPDEPEFDVDPPDIENAADDFDVASLTGKLDTLDEEHTEIAMARWTAAGIPPPNTGRLTTEQAGEAWALLVAVEQEATETYAARHKEAVAKMKTVGVTKVDAQATLLMEATNGQGGTVKRLSPVHLAALVAHCQAMADADAALEAEAS